MAFGEDVWAIKKKLAGELRSRREAAANEEWEMTGGEIWSFGEIPVEAEGSIFPGLVDEGNTVGMRAYLEREEAAESHRAGVVRLFLIEHAEHRRYVRKNFPLKMAGRFMLSLLPKETLEDFIRVSAEGGMKKIARTEEEFGESSAIGRGEWFASAEKVAGAVEANHSPRPMAEDSPNSSSVRAIFFIPPSAETRMKSSKVSFGNKDSMKRPAIFNGKFLRTYRRCSACSIRNNLTTPAR
jgi:hypothetical protein